MRLNTLKIIWPHKLAFFLYIIIKVKFWPTFLKTHKLWQPIYWIIQCSLGFSLSFVMQFSLQAFLKLSLRNAVNRLCRWLLITIYTQVSTLSCCSWSASTTIVAVLSSVAILLTFYPNIICSLKIFGFFYRIYKRRTDYYTPGLF